LRIGAAPAHRSPVLGVQGAEAGRGGGNRSATLRSRANRSEAGLTLMRDRFAQLLGVRL
jgi:hypothetical protein